MTLKAMGRLKAATPYNEMQVRAEIGQKICLIKAY